MKREGSGECGEESKDVGVGEERKGEEACGGKEDRKRWGGERGGKGGEAAHH